MAYHQIYSIISYMLNHLTIVALNINHFNRLFTSNASNCQMIFIPLKLFNIFLAPLNRVENFIAPPFFPCQIYGYKGESVVPWLGMKISLSPAGRNFKSYVKHAWGVVKFIPFGNGIFRLYSP